MANQKERRAAPRTTAPRAATSTTTARTAESSTAPRNAESTTAGASSAAPRPAANPKTAMSKEEVYRLIAETAYFKAKARGFEPGGEVRDWIQAEAEIRNRIEKGAAK